MNSTLLQSMEGIQVNTDVRKRIKNTQLKMVAANQKMRDLAINIRYILESFDFHLMKFSETICLDVNIIGNMS